MNFLSLLLLSFSLALDCFAVSVASGVKISKICVKHAFKMAFTFGFFQSLMAFIGAFFASKLHLFLKGSEKYVSAALLFLIGLKMLYEILKKEQIEKEQKNPIQIGILLILAIATSIDALAAGFSLSLSNTPITLSLSLIGGITFILSFIGIFIGEKLGHFFEKKLECIGAIIIISLGIKSLL